jgi:hypothetical protein
MSRGAFILITNTKDGQKRERFRTSAAALKALALSLGCSPDEVEIRAVYYSDFGKRIQTVRPVYKDKPAARLPKYIRQAGIAHP